MNHGFLSNLQQSLQITHILSTYVLSKIITIPDGDHFIINDTTSIRCLSSPKDPIGNVLILQGGVRHTDNNSYYVRTACSLMTRNVRVFLFEKSLPVVNYKFAKDVDKAIRFIRDTFDGPIVTIGYSMGGILLWTYLAMGYDSGDLYIPSCCPLDIPRFRRVVETHPVFRSIQNRAYKCYGVDGYDGLLEFSGSTMDEHNRFTRELIPKLNSTAEQWLSKTVYVISSNDPVTEYNDLSLLEKTPLTYVVKGGWHCCLDSTHLTTTLASRFIRRYRKDPKVDLTEIPVEHFIMKALRNIVTSR